MNSAVFAQGCLFVCGEEWVCGAGGEGGGDQRRAYPLHGAALTRFQSFCLAEQMGLWHPLPRLWRGRAGLRTSSAGLHL